MMFTKTTRRTGMLLHFASAHCCKQFVILHEMLASLFISTTTVVLPNNGFSFFFFLLVAMLLFVLRSILATES